MSKFNRLLVAEFYPPQNYKVSKVLTFDCSILSEDDIEVLRKIGLKVPSTGKITVPVGFATDLASVPRFCWNIIAPTDIARAAVIHDFLYRKIRDYKRLNPFYAESVTDAAKAVSDKIFKDAMEHAEPKIAKWKTLSAYLVVVLFGGPSTEPREELNI